MSSYEADARIFEQSRKTVRLRVQVGDCGRAERLGGTDLLVRVPSERLDVLSMLHQHSETLEVGIRLHCTITKPNVPTGSASRPHPRFSRARVLLTDLPIPRRFCPYCS